MQYIKIFEEFVMSLLTNESMVSYSPQFKKVLIRMKNPIAEELLKIEGQDKPITNNYFDVLEDGNDSVSFITDRKYKEISSKMKYGEYKIDTFDILSPSEGNRQYYSKLNMELPNQSDIKKIPVGEIGKVEKKWTSPSSGKVWAKFVPNDSKYDPIMININNLSALWDDSIFFKQNRQSTRIGRSLRSILTSIKFNFKDKDVEEFVNIWKSTIDRLNNIFSNFEVVSGDEISDWYHYTKYDSDRGQLGSSCMREGDDEWFEIYTCNPHKVSLVIFRSIDNHDKIKGRALLWTLEDGSKFMDRIYTNDDSDNTLFQEYSKANGWVYKHGYKGGGILVKDKDDKIIDLGNISIKLNTFRFDYYPYLDTLRYYNPSTGIITSDNKGRGGFLALEGTCGDDYGIIEQEEIWAPFYGRYFTEDELDNGDMVNCTYCDQIGGNIISGFRERDDCKYSDFYGVFVSNTLMERVGDVCSITGQWRLDKDLKKIHSDPRLKSKYIVSEYKGGDYLYSEYHDEFLPEESSIIVFTSMDKNSTDWRLKNDNSWREINGEKFDKSILIDKEIKKESFKWIKKFK